MYIHPDGSTTGSVNQQVLDAYNLAKKEGRDLSGFDSFLAENSPEAKLAAGAPEWQPPAPQEPGGQQAAAEPAAEQAPADDEYADWSLAELQGEAEARGLAKSGNKAEVADRLRQHD